ncbi:MAG: hypothetical protein ACKOW8_06880 [Flavobacteriales bacterium]
MKQIFQTWVVVMGIALTIGCSRKAYEESITEEPLFAVKGKINGQSFQLASGQNGQLITSSNQTDEFGYPEYISMFSPGGCTDCGPAFTFMLRDDYRVTDNNDASSILAATAIPFMYKLPDNSGLTYLLQAENSSYFFCEWMSGQNPLGNGSQIIQTYAQSGMQEVSLRLYHWGELQFIVTTTLDAGSAYAVATPFTMEVMEGHHWELHPSALLPDGLQSVNWEINGNSFAPDHIEITPSEGQVLRMNYYNSLSNQSGYYQIAIMEDEIPVLHTPLPSLNIFLKGVHEQRELFVLKYIDENGRKFSSVSNANLHRVVSMTDLGQSEDAIQGGSSELRLLQFDADLFAEDDTSVKLELRDFQVTTGFRP